MLPDRRGPGPPRTLGERVARLAEDLQRLAMLLKAEIARVVGEAVASAVRDTLRRLLGAPGESIHERSPAGFPTPEPWHGDPWQAEETEPESEPEPIAPAATDRPNGRWNHVWRTALQAGLTWLGRSGCRRPIVTTTLVALAAGGVAFALGPAASLGVGAAWAIAGVLLDAGSANAVGECIADLVT